MESYSHISGYEKLLNLYGKQLSFHDSEVITLTLDRGNPAQNTWSPSLAATFHLFAVSHLDTTINKYIFHKHSIATIRFGAISELNLEDFNNQNALLGLRIEPIENPVHEARFSVAFVPAFGVGCTFKCYQIELVSLVQGIPNGSIYA